jgi:hypothetical protein
MSTVFFEVKLGGIKGDHHMISFHKCRLPKGGGAKPNRLQTEFYSRFGREKI